MRNAVTILSIVCVFIHSTKQADLTEAQFAKTLSVFNSICQSKLNISDEQIEEVKKHPESLADDSKEKCFATCVLEMFNMVINGKIPTDLANESIVHFLPDTIKTTSQTALDTCRSSLDNSDNIHCVVGYNMLRCLAANNMKFFLL